MADEDQGQHDVEDPAQEPEVLVRLEETAEEKSLLEHAGHQPLALLGSRKKGHLGGGELLPDEDAIDHAHQENQNRYVRQNPEDKRNTHSHPVLSYCVLAPIPFEKQFL